jgi:hypothetical protein
MAKRKNHRLQMGVEQIKPKLEALCLRNEIHPNIADKLLYLIIHAYQEQAEMVRAQDVLIKTEKYLAEIGGTRWQKGYRPVPVTYKGERVIWQDIVLACFPSLRSPQTAAALRQTERSVATTKDDAEGRKHQFEMSWFVRHAKHLSTENERFNIGTLEIKTADDPLPLLLNNIVPFFRRPNGKPAWHDLACFLRYATSPKVLRTRRPQKRAVLLSDLVRDMDEEGVIEELTTNEAKRLQMIYRRAKLPVGPPPDTPFAKLWELNQRYRDYMAKCRQHHIPSSSYDPLTSNPPRLPRISISTPRSPRA